MADDDDPSKDSLADAETLIEFEWDEAKRQANLEKHSIDFRRARRAFFDPYATIVEGSRASNERRHLLIGRLDDVLITVVYTLRGERIRIISARRARRSERKRYGQ